MSERRFQVSLSTLLVVTLLASGMLWLNVRPRQSTGLYDYIVDDRSATGLHLTLGEYGGRGWPSLYETWLEDPERRRYEFDRPALALNVAACALLLFFAALLIEWGTRRVAARGRSATTRAAHEDTRGDA